MPCSGGSKHSERMHKELLVKIGEIAQRTKAIKVFSSESRVEISAKGGCEGFTKRIRGSLVGGLRKAANTLRMLKAIKISLPAVFVLCMLFLVAGGVAQLTNWRVISSTGNVMSVGVGIYWDDQCVGGVSSINWGVIEPGSSKNVTIYVRNEGNAAVTLSLNTTNWSPAKAPDYMAVSWDYGGQTINPNEVTRVTLTFSVVPNVEGITNYSFDVVIYAVT